MRVSPWRIIGWIVLAILVLSLAFCGYVCVRVADNSQPGSAPLASDLPPAAPHYQVSVISVVCENEYRDKARVTVRNTGMNAIPYAKLFVEFRDAQDKVVSADDSYFSPTTIPVNATASATVYSHGPAAKTCAPSEMQDRDGNPVVMIPPR